MYFLDTFCRFMINSISSYLKIELSYEFLGLNLAYGKEKSTD